MKQKEEIIDIVISDIDLYVINKVRELRVQKGLSQLKLSILMRLSEGVIGKIENPKERAKFNIRHLNLLAKALQCSPKEFMPEAPLENDMIQATIRIKRNKTDAKGDANFEILEIVPLSGPFRE